MRNIKLAENKQHNERIRATLALAKDISGFQDVAEKLSGILADPKTMSDPQQVLEQIDYLLKNNGQTPFFLGQHPQLQTDVAQYQTQRDQKRASSPALSRGRTSSDPGLAQLHRLLVLARIGVQTARLDLQLPVSPEFSALISQTMQLEKMILQFNPLQSDKEDRVRGAFLSMASGLFQVGGMVTVSGVVCRAISVLVAATEFELMGLLSGAASATAIAGPGLAAGGIGLLLLSLAAIAAYGISLNVREYQQSRSAAFTDQLHKASQAFDTLCETKKENDADNSPTQSLPSMVG